MVDHADVMNTLRHPGLALAHRAQSVGVALAPIVCLDVPEGGDLFEFVHGELEALGMSGGSFTLVSGNVARLSLMTGGPGRDGLPMGFHGPHQLIAPLTIVAGAAGSGVDEEGVRFTHCHACFRDQSGRLVGGHLIVGDTIAGDQGIQLNLTPIIGGRFEREFDSETHFHIFHPKAA